MRRLVSGAVALVLIFVLVPVGLERRLETQGSTQGSTHESVLEFTLLEFMLGAAQAQERVQKAVPTSGGGDVASSEALQERVDSLQTQVQRLSKDVGSLGEIAEQDSANLSQSAAWLGFVAELQERLRVMESTLSDLTGRVEQIERYGSPAQNDTREPTDATGGRSADERFSAAQTLLRAREVEQAVRLFDDFAMNYPNDPRVSEAFFYMGEGYVVLQDDKAAMRAFLNGYKKDRNGSFAPRLLLRLGQILAKLKKNEQACRVLREFQKRFGATEVNMTPLAEAELAANSCSGS